MATPIHRYQCTLPAFEDVSSLKPLGMPASSKIKDKMPIDPYPSPEIQPDPLSGLVIDPHLLAERPQPNYAAYDRDRSFSSVLINSTDVIPDNEQSLRQESIQTLQHNRHVDHQYFLNKGIFSDEQKAIIRASSHETPSSVMERLKEHDPMITHSYRQIKGAVENERRKKNRREPNGRWKKEELAFINQNMNKKPKELVLILKDAVPGCAKNVDQVRDMKNHLAQRARDREQ